MAPAVNLPISQLAVQNQWKDETHVYVCDNCGASEVLNRTEIATACAFCGTTNIVEKEGLAGLKPNAVVPFRLELDKAAYIACKWFKKRLFAPSSFKASAEPQEVKGVYYPAFAFNAETMSQFRGVLVRTFTTTTVVNGKPVVTTHEQRFPVSGNFPRNFNDILIQACGGLKSKTMRRIQPFSLNRMAAYSPDFLFGFVANQHTKDGRTSWNEARGFMDTTIRAEILRQYTYTRVESLQINTLTRGETFKYSMLPVYVGHCTYKGKLYNFYINGENGKLDAEAPLCAPKIILTILFPIGLLVLLGLGIKKLFKKIFKRRKKV